MSVKYVSEKLAIELKDIGFKKRVLTYYENGKTKIYDNMSGTKIHNNTFGWDFNTSFLTCVSRPTYSEVFDFFREKYNIEIRPAIVVQGSDKWYNISGTELRTDGYYLWDEYTRINTYEEAELICLEKLIKSVKP